MAKKSIEVLFQKEEYDKAITTIKQMLKEDTDNGELIYYLFLAENKDYANIDLNNIVNEVNFNRALDLSNRRLRNEFEAEYNFFRDSDPSFRKMFCYARRENKDKVLELFEKTNGPVTLPNDLDAYLDNMDYIVTSRVTKKALELNLLVVNLLFILSREKKLVSILAEIRNILVEIDSRYKDFKGFSNKIKLADFIFNSNDDKQIELVEVKEEPKKEEKVEPVQKKEEPEKNEEIELVEIKEAPKKKKSKSKLMRYFSNDETDDEIELYNKKMNPITKVFIVILWFVAIFMVLIAMFYFNIGH